MDNYPPVKWTASVFGDFLDFKMPSGCNVIIVGVQKHQFVPVAILLPHQLYRERLAKLLIEHDATVLHIAPYRSEDVMSFKMADFRAAYEA